MVTAVILMLAVKSKSSQETNLSWMFIKQISQFKLSNNPYNLQNLCLGKGELYIQDNIVWLR